MDKGSKAKRSVAGGDPAGVKAEGGAPTAAHQPGAVWVRDDGAICVGNECIVIKREPNTKNLDVEVAPTRCGEETGEAIVEHLLKTVGRGGNTRFTVKSELIDEDK
jgi:hypothetical protein